MTKVINAKTRTPDDVEEITVFSLPGLETGQEVTVIYKEDNGDGLLVAKQILQGQVVEPLSGKPEFQHEKVSMGSPGNLAPYDSGDKMYKVRLTARTL